MAGSYELRPVIKQSINRCPSGPLINKYQICSLQPTTTARLHFDEIYFVLLRFMENKTYVAIIYVQFLSTFRAELKFAQNYPKHFKGNPYLIS